MEIIKTIADLRIVLHQKRSEGKSVGFVPTMGFLHDGHLSLVRKARENNDISVVSIFVNPDQFGPNEDLDEYPRDENRDIELLEDAGVDILFLPQNDEMQGVGRRVDSFNNPKVKIRKLNGCINVIPRKNLINCLCGDSRPGHFEGVAKVVSKLFNIVQPNRAYFGQKDYQQFLIIKSLIEELFFPVILEMGETVREKGGLAKSSRNNYLNEEERRSAACLYRALKKSEDLCKSGFSALKNVNTIVSGSKDVIDQEKLVELDYFEIRNADDLSEVERIEEKKNYVIAGAIRIGKIRLIDNVLIKL